MARPHLCEKDGRVARRSDHQYSHIVFHRHQQHSALTILLHNQYHQPQRITDGQSTRISYVLENVYVSGRWGRGIRQPIDDSHPYITHIRVRRHARRLTALTRQIHATVKIFVAERIDAVFAFRLFNCSFLIQACLLSCRRGAATATAGVYLVSSSQ